MRDLDASLLDDRTVAFRARVRHFLQRALPPDIRAAGEAERMDLDKESQRRWHKLLRAEGLACAGWPASHGGPGLSDAEVAAYDKAQSEIAERILRPVKDKAAAMGIVAEAIHIPWRLPSRALVEIAGEKGCGLIVMSSHGRTGMDRAMLGSQTAEVLASATVPVLIAR